MVTGSATRQAPKQFLELHGQPILVLTVRAFLQVPAVHRIFVAVRKNEMQRVEAQLAEHDLSERFPWSRAATPARIPSAMP